MLAGGLMLSKVRRNEETKAGAAVWGKIWSSKVRTLVLKGTVQERWQRIQGLPLKPAASQGSELWPPGRAWGASSILAQQS